jgi:hypothetical protein
MNKMMKLGFLDVSDPATRFAATVTPNNPNIAMTKFFMVAHIESSTRKTLHSRILSSLKKPECSTLVMPH